MPLRHKITKYIKKDPSNTCFAVAHRRNKQRACGCDALALEARVAAASGRALRVHLAAVLE